MRARASQDGFAAMGMETEGELPCGPEPELWQDRPGLALRIHISLRGKSETLLLQLTWKLNPKSEVQRQTVGAVLWCRRADGPDAGCIQRCRPEGRKAL